MVGTDITYLLMENVGQISVIKDWEASVGLKSHKLDSVEDFVRPGMEKIRKNNL